MGGWLDTAAYTRDFESPGGSFAELTEQDLRRVAEMGWMQGEHKETNIRLVQFRSGQRAMDSAHAEQGYLINTHRVDDDGASVKGSGNGRYYL
ncbi:hypothetical protein ACFYW6_31015 [Streptomyces sp. NPDC002659]|uniref:hypothetical protein n=1 Tax=Streptomyces sp. NPDC002659 TaxID=3364656 RepID=UPI0036B52884